MVLDQWGNYQAHPPGDTAKSMEHLPPQPILIYQAWPPLSLSNEG